MLRPPWSRVFIDERGDEDRTRAARRRDGYGLLLGLPGERSGTRERTGSKNGIPGTLENSGAHWEQRDIPGTFRELRA